MYCNLLITAFLLSGRPLIVVNVACTDRLSADDVSRVEGAVKMAARANVRLALAGDFLSWNNVQSEYCLCPLYPIRGVKRWPVYRRRVSQV